MRSIRCGRNSKETRELHDGRTDCARGGGGTSCDALNAVASVLAFPLFGQLQNRPPVLQLSLKQAVEIAVAPEGSTRVRLAQEALKQAQTRADQARAALLPDALPTCSTRARPIHSKLSASSFPRLTFPASVSTSRLSSAVRRFRCPVQREPERLRFQLTAAYRASKVAIEAVKADNEGTRDQVTDQVARAYLASLRAEASLQTAQANVELSQALLRLAIRRRPRAPAPGLRSREPRCSWPTTGNNCWSPRTDGSIASAIVEGDRASARQSRGVTGKLEYIPIDRSTPSRRWRTRSTIAPS